MKIDYSKLKRAVKRTGAEEENSGAPIVFLGIKDRPRREPTITDFTQADLKRLRIIGGLLFLDGEAIVVHIYEPNITHVDEQRWSSSRVVTLDDIKSDMEKRPTIHLTNCQTIADMQRRGVFNDRYVKVTNPNGQFKIHPRRADKKRVGNELEVTLRPCINCLKKLNYEGCNSIFYTSSRRLRLAQAIGNDPEQIKKLVDTYSFIGDCASLHTPHTLPENIYTDDWHAVSGRVRDKADWTCQQCGVSLHDYRAALHAHHKNRKRYDNSLANLVALCALCHQQQPLHKHLHVPAEHSIAIISRRKAQGISSDVP
ncbi:MAG: HNH endonuclease [Alphaproteobacteria bacterium GM202ARS2]|nr:HNH endonuclease [Alphaproteobacteria bacterium GM202ARS2]